MSTYRARAGLNYPASAKDLELCKAGKPHKRISVEAGEIAEGIPAESIPWLLADRRIEETLAVKVVDDGDIRV